MLQKCSELSEECINLDVTSVHRGNNKVEEVQRMHCALSLVSLATACRIHMRSDKARISNSYNQQKLCGLSPEPVRCNGHVSYIIAARSEQPEAKI